MSMCSLYIYFSKPLRPPFVRIDLSNDFIKTYVFKFKFGK